MGLLNSIRTLGRLWSRSPGACRAQGTSRLRICRFEQMEPRQLLSVNVAPIHMGAVYYEDANRDDVIADTFTITFSGGAAGTQMTQLAIDGDKDGKGFSIGDCFFDTQKGGAGAYGAVGFSIVSSQGVDSIKATVVDGGTRLVLDLAGFDPGDKLVLSIDVDEWGPSSVAEGIEFEGSILTGTFKAPHYYDATKSDVFLDYFNDGLAASGLSLPSDDYGHPGSESLAAYTAGAFVGLEQVPLPSSLAGTVFLDPNMDNTQQSGERGIGDVTLTLHELVGSSYADTGKTTTTDSDGHYRFDDLAPGTYRVAQTQPDGLFSVGARAGKVGGQTRGVVTSVDILSGVNLAGGEDSVQNDFAETEPASLSGWVFEDDNDNGHRDSGEQGIGNVTIQVQYLGAGGDPEAVIEVETQANGYWDAGGLMPGNYRVDEIQPMAYLDGKDEAGNAGGTAHNPGDAMDGIHLAGGQAGINYNFGEIRPASLSGIVYVDPNGNLQHEAGELLISGVTVRLLDGSGNQVDTTETDENGFYQFTWLAPGTYRVEETQPAGYFDSADKVGTAGGVLLAPDGIGSIVLGAGVYAPGYDFTELQPASLSGRVYAQPGEEPIEGATINLRDATGKIVATTKTNAAGEYSFANLRPGTYRVEEIQPAGYFDSTDYVGSEGGTLDPSDAIKNITLGSGVAAIHYDFSEIKPAQLSGYVYLDDSNDGVRDPGEKPIEGVTVVLVDASGTPTGKTAVTDASGFYQFVSLRPGTYGVIEQQPAGVKDGLDTAGTAGGEAENPGDSISGAVLVSGTDAQEYNFGELRPASIGGRVHAELDLDCVLDPDEWPIAGVTVYLLDASGERIAETKTDQQGYYRFSDLTPDVYGVEEVQPAEYLDSNDHIGTAGGWQDVNDIVTGASLAPGVDATGYDFCEVVPATISGYVFQDGPVIRYSWFSTPPDPTKLRDGKFDAGDKPIAGVTLTLADVTGMAIEDAEGNAITTQTDKNGYYEFTGLSPGVYTVLERQPANYVDSLDTPGSSGGIALNPGQDVDPMAVEQMVVEPNGDAIIRIQLKSGEKATDYNFSEVVMEATPFWIPPNTPAEPFIQPPAPQPWGGSSAMGASYYSQPGSSPQIIFMGGGDSPAVSHTWHLSVVNGGQPRRPEDGMELSRTSTHTYFNVGSWSGIDVRQSYWLIADSNGKIVRKTVFGIRGAYPITGDWNGDGKTEVGVFLAGEWFLDLNGDNVWDEGDLWAQLGRDEDQPVSGDWDGDGKTDIGIFGPAWAGDPQAIAAEPGQPDPLNEPSPSPRYKNVPPTSDEATSGYRTLKHTSHGKLRADLIDHVFNYGAAGDRALAGDWNGDGVATIGVFRGGSWYLDVDGDGKWSRGDIVLKFGERGDQPLVGDWNGDGIDDVGVYRNGVAILDTNGDHKLDEHDKVFQLGEPGDLAVTGDFDGDGRDEVAVYHDMSPNEKSPQASEPHADDEVAARPEPAPK